MQSTRKIVVVSQHYPPDRSTTAAILSAIAEHLAVEAPVLVLSGTSGSASPGKAGHPKVEEIESLMPGKAALIRRAAAEICFTIRIFFALLIRLQREDVALTVTAPFMLPYAVAAATKLKRARSVLILHDLFPDVLVVSDIVGPKSLIAKMIRGANWLMFRALSAVIIIGRDTEPLLLRYGGAIREKISFIPNWATLTPRIRPVAADNPFRRLCKASFVVGLSGNLGFTHDPIVVFEAAKLLREDSNIHFLLSGWGTGFEQLKVRQSQANLPNVTLVERVTQADLEHLLSAADVWVIPYRKKVAGVSVPSRFYNLLAIGRPVVLISEPDAGAAINKRENDVCWVVLPGKPDELADALRGASLSKDAMRAERAVVTAGGFSFERAMTSYVDLMLALLEDRNQPEHI